MSNSPFSSKSYFGLRVLFTLFLSVEIAFSGTTGKLAGKVTDASTGEPLVGVNILLEGTSLGAATGGDGTYFILRIPPGTYDIKASMIGYNEVRVRGVRIRMDLTTTVNIELTPGVIGLEAVTITAERPMVQPDITYSQANVGSEEISTLPVEEFEEVVALQAGVVLGSDGSMHVRGGRGGEIAYLIDGVTVTDPFSSGMGVEIENNAIQELQFISGTFNAEYGQAMSGVVNIVTKDGSFDHYSGDLQVNFGDFWSQDTAIFTHIDHFDLSNLKDVQSSVNGPIPLLRGVGSFFASGRYFYDEGYLYGQRRYLTNSFLFNPETAKWEPDTTQKGDGLFVPMDWVEQISGQGKVNLKLGARSSVSLNLIGSDTRYRNYAHKFKYNPDGDYQRFRKNNSIIAKLEQSLSPSTFLILRYSLTLNQYRHYVYEDPVDTSYNVDPDIFNEAQGYNFYVGGIRMGHYNRKTQIQSIKVDLLSQVNKLHQVRLGTEMRSSQLYEKSFTILYDEDTGYKPEIPTSDTPFNNKYTKHPFEYSAYLQDKIEYNDLVINMGLRWDFFEPDGEVLADPSDPNYHQPLKPINQYFDENNDGIISEAEARPDNKKSDADRLKYWFRKTASKSQLSPRLALAFPITDKGVMHFSYGHFFQIPQYRYLYINPDFEITPVSDILGNANLEPERTTQYEVGFQQQIGSNLGLDMTGFYKDIRNLLGIKIVDVFGGGDRYFLYVNRDYGNVRGIVISITRRPTGFISGTLSYTYSISEGNASDPAAAYYDEQAGNEPEKQLVALDWDQRHTLNTTITFHAFRGSGISFIGQYGSGLPYTPSLAGTRIAFENSERRPDQFNVDIRSYWNFKILGLNAALHFNIYNLFDRRNEVSVYYDTGRAGYSLIPTYTPQEQRFNTLDEYLTRPDFYSPPRQVKIGLTVKI